MRIDCDRRVAGLAVAWIICAAAVAQERESGKRVPLPRFTDAETEAVFFPDVFSRLLGERPGSPSATFASPAAGSPSDSSPEAGRDSFAWSKIISPTTLEDEVKSIKMQVDLSVTTPRDFAGRGHKEVRRDFSVLAMLFAIIADYDGDVRWQDSAPIAVRSFARTAVNAKAGGSSNVYNEAKLRKQDLDDLLRGSRLSGEVRDDEGDWGSIAGRQQLMQRLETSFQQRLSPWTSSPDAVADNAEGVLHEGEMVAAIAHVLTKEGMADGDDADYVRHAERMQQAAQSLVAAVKRNSHEQARQALGEITKACTECHEVYR